MRRIIAICVLVLAGVTASAAGADMPAHARLRSFVCQRAMDPGARAISVTAVMRPLSATAKMAMRFELLRRANRHARSLSVTAHGLKDWITPSDPTLGQRPGDVWVVHHPVVDLSAPAYYRFRVSFRWTDASGRSLGTTVLRSVRCFEPELRPNLAVPAVKITPLKAPGLDRYAVVVANRGQSASGPFSVELSLNGTVVASTPPPVESLAPHSKTVIRFSAPACTVAEPISVVADPGGIVDDFNRANNTLAETCPGPTAPGTARRAR